MFTAGTTGAGEIEETCKVHRGAGGGAGEETVQSGRGRNSGNHQQGGGVG